MGFVLSFFKTSFILIFTCVSTWIQCLLNFEIPVASRLLNYRTGFTHFLNKDGDFLSPIFKLYLSGLFYTSCYSPLLLILPARYLVTNFGRFIKQLVSIPQSRILVFVKYLYSNIPSCEYLNMFKKKLDNTYLK